MNMRDALRKRFTGLDGRDDPMFKETAGAISCRLLVLRFLCFLSGIRTDIALSSLGIHRIAQLR